MPIARIQMPDGRIARMEVPEGTTPEQAIEFAQNLAAQPSVMDAPNIEQAPSDINPSGATSRFLQGLGHGLKQPLVGFQQHALGQYTPQDIDLQRQLFAPVGGTTAGRAGEFIGQAVPSVALALATRGKTLLENVVGQGATGITQGLLTPTGTGEDVSTNALYGGVGGAIGGGLGYVAGRALTPVPGVPRERLETAALARQHGIQPLPSQVTGSKMLRTAESLSAKAPELEAANQLATNKWATALIGQPQATTVTREVLDTAYDTVDAQIGRLAQGSVLNTHHPDYIKSVRDLFTGYSKLEPEVRAQMPKVQNMLQILYRWAQQGSIDGDVYQANRSMIGKLARGATGPEQHFYGKIIDAMDEAAPNQAAWQAARNQYRNILALDKPNVVDSFGNVRGAALWTTAKKATPEMRELATVAKAFPQRDTSNFTPPASKLAKALVSSGGGIAAGGIGAASTSAFYGARDPAELIESGLYGAGAGLAGSQLLKQVLTNPMIGNYIARGAIGGRNLSPSLVPLSPFGAEWAINRRNNPVGNQ